MGNKVTKEGCKAHIALLIYIHHVYDNIPRNKLWMAWELIGTDTYFIKI